jgi:hypothetical protein
VLQGQTYIEYEDVRDLSSTVDVMIQPIASYKIDPTPAKEVITFQLKESRISLEDGYW